MDIRKIKKLIEILEKSSMAEIDIKEGEDAIRISRFSDVSQTLKNTNSEIHSNTESHSATIPSVTTEENTSAKKPTINEHHITSPIVGTFYIAPAPDANAFVSVGQTIKKGDTVCIIEAMKIMNKIEADHSGTVEEILVKDGDAVEFGQSLIKIK